MAALADGQLDRADAVLADAVEVGMDIGALPATALAERCLVAIQRGDWAGAHALAEQAVGIVATGQLEDYIMSALVHASGATRSVGSPSRPGCCARAAGWCS